MRHDTDDAHTSRMCIIDGSYREAASRSIEELVSTS